jgi:ribonuclease BN (tRNA processing enzyme)
MKLRILGCSGGIGGDLRTTSMLVDEDILIDAGTGISNLTLDEMADLRHIFLTHSHLDHIANLPLLVDSVFEHIKQPIIIHAQEVTIKALKEHIFNWVIWPDFSRLPTPENPVLAFQSMSPGEVVSVGERNFEMIPVNHSVPSVGYYVTGHGKAFAFSGDTTTNDTFWAGLNLRDQLDMLIIEVAFPNSEIELSRAAYHYCPSLLAQDIVKLNHSPDIYVSHPKPGQEAIIEKELAVELKSRKFTCLKGNELFKL